MCRLRQGFAEEHLAHDLPFQENDSVMADKGFTIQDLLPLGVSLNIPPFLGTSSQMPAEEVIKTQEIASLRIHVERAINKIKNFTHLGWGYTTPSAWGCKPDVVSVCNFMQCSAKYNFYLILLPK